MTTWMSETEFRAADPQAVGVTINVPFLQEIKQDYEFRSVLTQVYQRLNTEIAPTPRVAAELLAELRDQLETYFTLEDFYGYFKNSAETNPTLSKEATNLKSEHSTLYLQFNEIVDLSEQIVYQECGPDVSVKSLAERLDQFCQSLADHEQQEMDLMMRTHNQDLGVGD